LLILPVVVALPSTSMPLPLTLNRIEDWAVLIIELQAVTLPLSATVTVPMPESPTESCPLLFHVEPAPVTVAVPVPP
jgi:hypothetical protein